MLAVACLISVKTCQNNEREASIKIASLTDTVTTYKNKNGELIAQVETMRGTMDELKGSLEAAGVQLKDLKKQIGSLNNLVSYLTVKASVTNTVTVTNTDTVYVDSTGTEVTGRQFAWSNKWMQLDGVSFPLSTTIRYKYDIEFNTVTYRIRRGFLMFGKPDKYVTDIKFSDPGIFVSNMRSITVEPNVGFFRKPVVNFALGAIGMYFLMR